MGPGHIVLDGDPPSPQRKLEQQPPLSQFTDAGNPKPRPMSIVAKRLDGSGCYLVRR